MRFDDYFDAACATKGKKRILVFSGAGISVPSGIPDFRSPKGVWDRYPEEYGSIDYYHRFPEKFWKLNHDLFSSDLKDAKPNEAHFAVAELETLGFEVLVATQNIDGFHSDAGSSKVIELHGNSRYLLCLKCKDRIETATYNFQKDVLPKCEKCSAVLKPDMVYFGELVRDFEKAAQFASKADVCIIAGTSGAVGPANQLPQISKSAGALVFEFNLKVTSLSQVADYIFPGSIETTLPAFLEMLK